MTTDSIELDKIPPKSSAKIQQIKGGHGLIQKLQVMGIRTGQIITLSSKQPLRGPITIKINDRELTLGRGMAKKIMVEVIR